MKKTVYGILFIVFILLELVSITANFYAVNHFEIKYLGIYVAAILAVPSLFLVLRGRGQTPPDEEVVYFLGVVLINLVSGSLNSAATYFYLGRIDPNALFAAFLIFVAITAITGILFFYGHNMLYRKRRIRKIVTYYD